MSTPDSPICPRGTHRITDHHGVLGVRALPGRDAIELAFDPAVLGEQDVRNILREHLDTVAAGPAKRVMRLDGQACEAAAARLAKRVEAVPGVRHATATYIGRVLCLTFDRGVRDEDRVLREVREAGARISPIEPPSTLVGKIRAGELNEELSCGIGFLCLIAAVVADRLLGNSSPASWACYAGAYLFLGQYGVRSAVASLRERTLDVDLLMVLAAIGAAIVGSPFEGALLLFLFSFSNVLQRYALGRTQRAIQSLLKLRPDQALRKTATGTELVRVAEISPGEVVIVRPGEHVPVDGVISEGETQLDESSLTGESLPVTKGVGGAVFAGTLNQSGAVEVTVTKGAGDSTLAKMIALVAEAQAEKSRAQRFLERAEQYYAAGVLAFTALVLLVPWLGWGQPFAEAFYRAMTVMVVASPCAIVISTPATVLSAIGGAARRGILIKGGSHLERASKVEIVAFDKTGTLTRGKPSVTEVIAAGRVARLADGPLPESHRSVLALCAALEAKSEHPLAAAIVHCAEGLGLPLGQARGFVAEPGKGARASVGESELLVGSERYFREAGVAGLEELTPLAAPLQAAGRTCIWLAEHTAGGARAVAAFALADRIRPEARELIARLKSLGIRRTLMLTGDHPSVAAVIAAEAGIDEFRAGLLPEDKVQAIRKLKAEGVTMMVGDGVNDAPALAGSDLGVAMGAAGTDVAMETADVVLMGDRIENVATLLGMAQHAGRVLIQNLTFASAVIVCLVAAALGLNLPLPLGVVGHEGSTVLVCLNGLRLLAYRPRFRAARSA